MKTLRSRIDRLASSALQGAAFAATLAAAVLSALPSQALAEVYLRGRDLSPEAFAARVAARSDAVPLIEHLEATFPLESQSRKLTAAFSKSQALFLDGESEEAERAFKEVFRMARDADWRDSQRKAIAFAAMRLAQLAASKASVEERLEEAAAFAPDLRPDADAFPPPLVSAWEKAAARVKTKSVLFEAADKFPGYEVVKVDGRAFSVAPGSLLALPPGPHRVSALSNAHPYFAQVMTAEQLKALRVDQPPLASGDCEAPRLSGLDLLATESARVAFSDCTPRFDRGGWTREPSAPTAPKLGVLPGAESGGAGAPAWARLEAAQPETTRSTKWLWVAAAAAVAVAVGFVVYKAQEPAPAAGPTQPGAREGL